MFGAVQLAVEEQNKEMKSLKQKIKILHSAPDTPGFNDNGKPEQAIEIAQRIVSSKILLPGMEDLDPEEQIRELSQREIIALIAYMQKLGDYEVVESAEPRKRKFL